MKEYLNKAYLLSLILVLLFTALLLKQAGGESFSPWEIENIIGKEAPDFTIKDLSGRMVALSSFRGKPILLNFWATWCPYCREERPQLDFLHERYKDKGLVIIAVSIDRSVAKVKRYLEKIPADYVVLIDEETEVARTYGVFALPTSFLIDREGKIRHKFMGMRKWTDEASKELIEEFLME